MIYRICFATFQRRRQLHYLFIDYLKNRLILRTRCPTNQEVHRVVGTYFNKTTHV